MTIKYEINPFVRGINSYGALFSEDNYSAILAANTASSVTVPGTPPAGFLSSTQGLSLIAHIETSNVAFVSISGTATVPVGGTFASSNSEQVSVGFPKGKLVRGGQTISVIAPNANTYVTITFYAFPG